MKASDWIQIYFGTEKGLCYDVKKKKKSYNVISCDF